MTTTDHAPDTRYVPTDPAHRRLLARSLLRVILDAGFIEEADRHTGVRERVFYRGVDNFPSIRVKVFTTIEGYDDPIVRDVGDDAIRVSAVYRNDEKFDFGIVATTRIHRMGTIRSIADRLLARMREVYGKALHVNTCKCGAPMHLSKKGHMVCANVCWTRRTGSGKRSTT